MNLRIFERKFCILCANDVLIIQFIGTVVEKNEAVESGPSLINTSAMDEGWLFKVKLQKPEEIDELMNQEAYDKYLKEHEEE